MESATGMDSVMFALSLQEGLGFYVAVGTVALLIVPGLRFAFMFREHYSWVTLAIRLLCGFIPLIVVVYGVFVFAGSSQIQHFDWQDGFGAFMAGGIGLAGGVVIAYLAGRRFEPWVLGKLEEHTQRAGLSETLTDIRDTQPDSQEQIQIDFEKEFERARAADEVFLGLDENEEAVTIDRRTWKSSHVQIMGPPGTGKGIQAGVTLTQSLRFGDAVFVFDPKHDEWAPSVFRAGCKKAGVRFHFIDLNEAVPQINPLKNATSDEAAEMLYAGLGLGRRGTEADYYRLDDRKAARLASEHVRDGDISLAEMASRTRAESGSSLMSGAKAFFAALEEISELPCVRTREGIDLGELLNDGGCVYIVGSMRNEPIVILQKMLFVRLIQIIERTRDRTRHCSIFLDEFKHLLSVATVNALGAIRDKGCNILLAHQSLGDFANCGADLSETSVRSTVLDTTPIKWLYRPSDQETAAWIANQSGRVVITTQRYKSVRNLELAESASESRMIGETERNLYDTNTVMSLPRGSAVCIGVGLPTLARVCAIEVERVRLQPNSAPALEVSTELNVLERMAEPVVDVLRPNLSLKPIFEEEPESRLLRYLFEETWTHTEIIHDLVTDVPESDIASMLVRLQDEKLIRSCEFAITPRSTDIFWGITQKGVEQVKLDSGRTENRPSFTKRMLNPTNILHRLDVQRLRLVAERNGWRHWWSEATAGVSKKGGIRPDAIVQRPDGLWVAIEVERILKSRKRYPDIFARHLNAWRERHWDLVYYLCPDRKTASGLKTIYSEISQVEIVGLEIGVTDEHRSRLRFFACDEEWTSSG